MYIRFNENLSFGLFCLNRKTRILKSVCLNRVQFLSTFLHSAFNFSSLKRVKQHNQMYLSYLLMFVTGYKIMKINFALISIKDKHHK